MGAITGHAPTKHVAVLAFPFGTHAIPLLNLVRRISSSAPDLKFSFFSTARSNEFIFKEPIDNIKPFNVSDGLPEGYVFKGNPLEMIDLFLKSAPEAFSKGMEEAVVETGREIGCVVSDAFLWFAAEIAVEMVVPWVPLWTAAPRSLLIHVETDLIQEKLGSSGFQEKVLDFLPDFSAIRGMDLPDGVVGANLESCFAIMQYKMGQILPQATAVAINSFEDVDPDMLTVLRSKFKKFLNVGPFILTSPPPSFSDEHGCLSWLEKQEPNSVAYISFGSFLTPPPNEIAALAEALEQSKYPFLWSFRGNAEETMPKGFLERTKGYGKIVPWAPQLEVLGHKSVGVFITHCGWNSVLESIVGGVPMICRPFLGDQNLNRRIIEAVWGIGLGAEGGTLTKEGVMKGLESVLSSKEGNAMRDKVIVLRELALKAVEPSGSSSQNFNYLFDLIKKC